MKKLLCIILALMLPLIAVGEETAVGIIGGADGPTSLFVTDSLALPGILGEKALAAGRKVTTTMKVTEFSGLDLGSALDNQAFQEILRAMTIVTADQGDEKSLTLQMGGKDVLNLGMALNGKDAYILTNLLGSAIVVNEAEVEGLISRVLDMLVRMDVMSSSEAKTLNSQIQMFAGMLAQEQVVPVEAVDLMAELEKLDYSAIEESFALAYSKVVEVEAPVVPRMCDPAVRGATASVTNEELAEISLLLCQFVLDNPQIKDFLSEQMDLPTEAELTAQWESSGMFYKALGIYADEAAFRASQKTVDSFMAEVMEEIRTTKVIEGEYVISAYTDAEGKLVYITLDLPLYVEEEAAHEHAAEETEVQTTGRVMPINAVYTRQTVADGVSHVCNINIDGDVLSTDMLVREDETLFALYVTEPDDEPIKFMDAVVRKVDDILNVEANIYDGPDQKVLSLQLEGECEFTDVRSYLSGKLAVTVYEEVEGENAETTLAMELSTDTAINGVDFFGVSKFAMQADDVRFAMQMDYATADPEETIMSGAVIRPAELDDAAFTSWFISVFKNVNLWQANFLDALPESMLKLVLFEK